MEPSKTHLIFLLVVLVIIQIALPVFAQEKSIEFKNVNPLASLPAPGSKIKVEIQALGLPNNTDVFLATILDNQLILIKADNSKSITPYLSFSFPAPLVNLKYFPLASKEGSIIGQGNIKELTRNCIPSADSNSTKDLSPSDQLLIKAKTLEQEISNLEQAHKNILQLKNLLTSRSNEA